MKHCFPEEPKSCLTLLEMFFTLCEAAFELPVDQQQPVNVPFSSFAASLITMHPFKAHIQKCHLSIKLSIVLNHTMYIPSQLAREILELLTLSFVNYSLIYHNTSIKIGISRSEQQFRLDSCL